MTRKELCARSGATYAQVGRWAQNRLLPSTSGCSVPPGGRGKHFRLTEEDCEAVKAAISARQVYGKSAARKVLEGWNLLSVMRSELDALDVQIATAYEKSNREEPCLGTPQD